MANFIIETVTEQVRVHKELDLVLAMSEHAAFGRLRAMAAATAGNKNYISLGYSPVRTPAVIQGNVLANSCWEKTHTPYQA